MRGGLWAGALLPANTTWALTGAVTVPAFDPRDSVMAADDPAALRALLAAFPEQRRLIERLTSTLGSSSLDLFVSPNGSDAAAGTQAAPFRTVRRCAAAAPAGATCHLAAGLYEEQDTVEVARDLTIAGAGASASTIDASRPLTNLTWTREAPASCIYVSSPTDPVLARPGEAVSYTHLTLPTKA